MEPQVGDVIEELVGGMDRIRRVVAVIDTAITYTYWHPKHPEIRSTGSLPIANFYGHTSAYKITRSKQYLISKFNEVWKNS